MMYNRFSKYQVLIQSKQATLKAVTVKVEEVPELFEYLDKNGLLYRDEEGDVFEINYLLDGEYCTVVYLLAPKKAKKDVGLAQLRKHINLINKELEAYERKIEAYPVKINGITRLIHSFDETLIFEGKKEQSGKECKEYLNKWFFNEVWLWATTTNWGKDLLTVNGFCPVSFLRSRYHLTPSNDGFKVNRAGKR